MQRAANYSTVTDIYTGTQIEKDSFTCNHCQKVVTVEPRQRPEDIGGMCKVCFNLVCPECVGLYTCDVFEKKLERMEASDRFRRQAGLL